MLSLFNAKYQFPCKEVILEDSIEEKIRNFRGLKRWV
jgi:hypothetical protein